MTELERYKESHPNLTTFWSHYINLKKRSFEKTIQECQLNLEKLSVVADVNLTNLLLVYIAISTENQHDG